MTNQDLVRQKTEEVMQKARTLYGVNLTDVTIQFNIKGWRVAGMAKVQRGRKYLRYHPKAVSDHLDRTLNVTVPHEVAHLVGYELGWGFNHGLFWKNACIALGGTGERTHNLDLGTPDIATRLAKRAARMCFIYIDTKGKERRVTKQRHNRMHLRGTRYVFRDNQGTISASEFVRQDMPMWQSNRLPAGAVRYPFPPKAPKLPRKPQARRVKGAPSKADLCRALIRQHYGQVTDETLIDLIAQGCGFKRQLAKAYFNANLARAWAQEYK
jgi:predicted SprT family Zn-dependent metalloprotease